MDKTTQTSNTADLHEKISELQAEIIALSETKLVLTKQLDKARFILYKLGVTYKQLCDLLYMSDEKLYEYFETNDRSNDYEVSDN